jgi:hypothetical protein
MKEIKFADCLVVIGSVKEKKHRLFHGGGKLPKGEEVPLKKFIFLEKPAVKLNFYSTKLAL